MRSDLFEYVLWLADDALITGQRLAEWSARAPEMEEDIALSNIALDQFGVARLLLTYAGEVEDRGRDEDDLAYLREDGEFRNCLLVELPNGGPNAIGGEVDFGVTLVRMLLLSCFQQLTYDALVDSTDQRLADVAGKARKEVAYHLDHAAQWTVRLGDGTKVSHQRAQAAIDDLWPYTHELFVDDPVVTRLAEAGVAVLPSSLSPSWRQRVAAVLDEATLVAPADGWSPSGGRQGQHTEHLSYLLGEMQVLHRAHPGASW